MEKIKNSNIQEKINSLEYRFGLLEKEVDNLKNNINSLLTSSGGLALNCSSVSTFIGEVSGVAGVAGSVGFVASTSLIPVIGEIVGVTFGIIAASCAIAGV